MRKCSWIAFCTVLWAICAQAQDKVIRWATNPQYPPYDWSVDGDRYAGACIDLLALVIPKGYSLEPVVVPWPRAQKMAKEGRIDLLVNLRITPERSKWLEFSKNPTFANPISVFMRKEDVIPLKSWDELILLKGGVTIGDAFGNGFDNYLKDNLKVEASPNVRSSFLKLDVGRIDYFVTGYYTGMAWLSSEGLQDRIVTLKPPISDTYIHLGFSKLSPHLAVLPEIDRKLSELGADGTLKRILQSHIESFK